MRSSGAGWRHDVRESYRRGSALQGTYRRLAQSAARGAPGPRSQLVTEPSRLPLASSAAFAVITPAKDEELNLQRLASCMTCQTAPPALWIVVNDGSTDSTRHVAKTLAKRIPWVHAISRAEPGPIARGGRTVRCFLAGAARVPQQIAYVGKLDADVSIAPDYFARLLGELERDDSLGLVSGTCRQWTGRAWENRYPSSGVIRGAARLYRRACLESVLPLEERIGWDGIDSVKAQLRGWRTHELADLPFYHHRGVGARDGRVRAGMALGEVAYYLHYRPSYLLLRTIFRATQDWSLLALPAGYAGAALRREPRCQDIEMVDHIRELQRYRNIPFRLHEVTGSSRLAVQSRRHRK